MTILPGFEDRDQALCDPGSKGSRLDRSVEDKRRDDAFVPQPGERDQRRQRRW
jgi:hypothetical protein